MAGRFRVSSVAGGREPTQSPEPIEVPSSARSTASPGPQQQPHHLEAGLKRDAGAERIPLCEQHSPLALYEEDYEKGTGQKIGQMLRSFGGYNETLPTSAEMEEKAKAAAKLGTLMGVFFPCMQNIFGVLFFIRLSWIIGTAGIINGLVVVLSCVSVTFLTSISLSAIATNGVVSGGGPYYMISRNLGPELGGAVGILFYLGTTIAASMYITGAVEIVILYMWPEIKFSENLFHNYRVYGSVLLVLLGMVVLAGVKVVNKFALPVVFVVLLCITSVFIGMFVNFSGSDTLKFCMVGDRMVDLVGYGEKYKVTPPACNATELEALFCKNGKCNRYFDENRHRAELQNGIPGFTSGVVWDNLWPKYLDEGDMISKNPEDAKVKKSETDNTEWYLYADIATSYMILVGVFFPSATGIMAGSNRSGNLQDPSLSIPLGTLAAQLITSAVYLSAVIFVGGSTSDMLLRDKLGSSALGALTMTRLSWPAPYLVLVGSCLATLGAGLQSLTGAPRLLQAIAADDVIPFLSPFRTMDGRGEPIRAIFITLLISEIGILIAVIENIAALITQFFLMCYLGVNTACALQSLLRAPGWRPGFRYYHWSLSCIGAFLCVAVMFISAWHYAIIAIIIGIGVYKYIEFIGAEKEWGDGIRGLRLSAARFALLNLDERQEHTRNWRPQLLVVMNGVEGEAQTGYLSFTSQLKAGKGLTLLVECVKGNFNEHADQAEEARQEIRNAAKQHRIKCFSDVLMTDNIEEGLCSMIQTAGLGGMRHNSVLLNWPREWTESHDWDARRRFINVVRASAAAKCAIIVTKGAENLPRNTDRMNGTIDVWWIVHDGGLLMLLPFLLKQHKVWRSSHLRLFVVATMEENNVQMKTDLQKFLYQLRISAEVAVIEMPDSDISDYTYERTLKMEERFRLLKDIKMKKDLQMHLDDVTRERKLSKVTEEDANLHTPIRERSNLEVVLEETLAENGHHKEEGANGSPAKPKNNGRGVRFSEEDEVDIEKGGNGSVVSAPKSALNDQMQLRRRTYNVHKMHTAVKLNELMRQYSAQAQLVVVNLPSPPQNDTTESFYMDFIEALTESISRVLLVKGTGREVVTIYS